MQRQDAGQPQSNYCSRRFWKMEGKYIIIFQLKTGKEKMSLLSPYQYHVLFSVLLEQTTTTPQWFHNVKMSKLLRDSKDKLAKKNNQHAKNVYSKASLSRDNKCKLSIL